MTVWSALTTGLPEETGQQAGVGWISNAQEASTTASERTTPERWNMSGLLA